LSYSVAQ